MGEIVCQNENSELTEAEQKDLFGEPIIAKPSKQLPHRNSNIRRERFVYEYVINGRNATQAALVAGYGKGTFEEERKMSAKKYGSWLLRQPDVIAALSHFEGVLEAKNLIRAEEIVEAIWETYNEPRLAPSRREPLLSLLAKMGRHLESDKIVNNNLLNMRELVAADAANSPMAESNDISRPSEDAGKTGGV